MNLIIPLQDGNLLPTQHDQRVIQSWKREEVIVKPYDPKRDRSSQQNRYYWSVVLGTIAAETAHTPEEIHEWAKAWFLPRTFITMKGREYEVGKSTTSLSTEEFSRYVEQIKAWAGSELSISIPDPS
ncbi:hypothetical protein Pan258_02300 [Symmachiella dynata]|uniref:hypothetical protein n=1 Tax=Symmachiella dynata TaxID=2527995 RepID=UPI00118D08B9|nr:hypothetical protein [Symmachiella dynata]QDT46213.1 hypothetical protein Pan258_02300 [Symmachiella dynata]